MLEGRLPPARAGGAPGDDADAGARDGQQRRHRRDRRCAAASAPVTRDCVVIEDDNPDRVRGIVHANRLAQALMSEGPDAPLAPLVREALIMPETKPLDDLLDRHAAPALLAGRDRRRVRPHGRDRHDRGHHRGDRGRDRRRDRPGAVVDPPARERRLVRARPRVARRPRGRRASTCRSTPTPTRRSAGYVFDELGRLPKRGDRSRANGYLIRVESVRENRVEAVRIHPSAEPSEAPRRRPGLTAAPSAVCPRAPSSLAAARTRPRGFAVWCARFTESQLETLKDLIRIQGEVGADLEGALEAWSWRAGTTSPRRSCPGPTSASRPSCRASARPTWCGTWPGRKKEPAAAASCASRASRAQARAEARRAQPAG